MCTGVLVFKYIFRGTSHESIHVAIIRGSTGVLVLYNISSVTV
jgi:hypothetical protein